MRVELADVEVESSSESISELKVKGIAESIEQVSSSIMTIDAMSIICVGSYRNVL